MVKLALNHIISCHMYEHAGYGHSVGALQALSIVPVAIGKCSLLCTPGADHALLHTTVNSNGVPPCVCVD